MTSRDGWIRVSPERGDDPARHAEEDLAMRAVEAPG